MTTDHRNRLIAALQ